MTTKADAHFVDCDLSLAGVTSTSSPGVLLSSPELLGWFGTPYPHPVLLKILSDGSVDSSWATDGGWGLPELYDCAGLARTSDGGVIVAHHHNDYSTGMIFVVGNLWDTSNPMTVGEEVTGSLSGATGTLNSAFNTSKRTGSDQFWQAHITDITGTFERLDVLTGTTSGNTCKLSSSPSPIIAQDITKLDSDGVIDTTWGYSGHTTANIGAAYLAGIIIVDSNDNVYLGTNQGGSGSTIQKLNSDGIAQWGFSYRTEDTRYPASTYCAQLIDNETKIVIGGYMLPVATNKYGMCLDVSDGSIVLSWGDNGYIKTNSNPELSHNMYAMRKDANENLYIAYQAGSAPTNSCIAKYNSSGILDTSWGTSGRIGDNEWPVYYLDSSLSYDRCLHVTDDGVLYALTHPTTDGFLGVNRVITYTTKYTTAGIGTRIIEIELETNQNWDVNTITVARGRIYLGGAKHSIEGFTSSLHIYDTDGTYLSDFEYGPYTPGSANNNIIQILVGQDTIITK